MADTVVIRQGSYNHGMIVADMLLPDDQLFQVTILLYYLNNDYSIIYFTAKITVLNRKYQPIFNEL